MLADIDLVGDLEEPWAGEVLQEFSRQSKEGIRKRLTVEDPDFILHAYSIISPKGFGYFLPTFLEFCESEDSREGGWQFASWMTLAISNQLRIHPHSTLNHGTMILRIIDSISGNVSRFSEIEPLGMEEDEDLRKLQTLRDKILTAQIGAGNSAALRASP